MTLAVLAAVLAGAACGPRGGTWPMTPLPPPEPWREELQELREIKDDHFRRSDESPLPAGVRESFEGLDYWAPDPDYYFVGTIYRYPDPERFQIITTTGETRPCERLGWLEFELDGRPMTLQVYRLLDGQELPGETNLFLPFLDATSGEETYPAGRYLDLFGPPGGPWVLDFNRAYNPSCAYGDPSRFACPRAPEENRLPVRVEAGERGYHEPPAPAANPGDLEATG